MYNVAMTTGLQLTTLLCIVVVVVIVTVYDVTIGGEGDNT